MMSAAIEVTNLVKVYEKSGRESVRALDGISFSVRPGEIFGLLGPNGAGKTTTLKILTTLLKPTSGSVSVLGYDVLDQPLDVRRQICVVLQENAVESFLSVWNNLLVFGRFHGLSRKEIEMRSGRVLELFGLRECLHQRAIDLSGGLKRRLQVAKMFLVDKPIVFLDEATTGMDTINKRTTLQAIKEESLRGRTIVLTTHMLEEAEELCTSLAIVNHGRIIAAGSMEQVKAKTLRLYYLSMTFERITGTILRSLKHAAAVTMDIKNNSVEMSIKDQRAALAVATRMNKTGLLQHFEISSASLEDVFVELLDKKTGMQ